MVGAIIIVIDFVILTMVSEERPYSIVGSIGMFATGIVMGSFIKGYGVKDTEIVLSYVVVVSVIGLIHFLLLVF